MPITIAHADADQALAQKLAQDLARLKDNRAEVLIVLASAASTADKDVQRQIADAADAHRHIVPVRLDDSKLPRLIDHLEAVDFRNGAYALDALKKRLEAANAPDAPRPLTVNTPKLQRANRRAALWVAMPVIASFAAAIYLMGVMGVTAPSEEFDLVETARVQQRNTLIGPTLDYLLADDGQTSADFEATVAAAPTRLRPFLAQTATATIQGTHPVTNMPRLTATPPATSAP
jgi:hypothetical protein